MRADDGGRGGAERQREREQEFYCFPLISGKIGSDGKVFAYNAGDQSLIPGSGRSSGEGNGNPLQYSCLENPMDEGAWQTYHPWGRKESDTTSLSLSFLKENSFTEPEGPGQSKDRVRLAELVSRRDCL